MSENIEILIVEDSLTQALHLQDSLERNGYKCQIANNGRKGLEYLKEHNITMVISDIVMPEMDGYELCKNMKQNQALKDIPIILLTSLSDPHDVIRALECGADNFVTKPYDEKFLLTRIKNILANIEIRKSGDFESGIEIVFAGKKHFITSSRMQIVDLLFSTYENAIFKNHELEKVNRELVITQRELEQKNLELGKLNEQKNHFLGMAAHDLRNPMGAIFNSSELFLDGDLGELTEEQEDIIKSIKSSSEFMLHLVNEFLDIAKIESGKLSLNLSETNIFDLMEQNISFNKMFATKKDIQINFQYDPHIKYPVLMLDSSKMQQVLNNLISNAIKFSFAGGNLFVGLSIKPNYILIYVKDEGQGIPEEEQDKLFNPFQKTSVKSTAGEKSTGLGLAIVKKIIVEHKGKIWVESIVGKGSTFFISLPYEGKVEKIASEEPQELTQKDTSDSSETDVKMLLVEDNITSKKVAVKILSKLGYETEVASNGQEAIELMEKIRFDIVFMDIQMPVMDGYKATNIVRDPSSNVLNHDVPIIAMTAADVDWNQEILNETGMNSFLTKPIHRDKLSSIIDMFTNT